MLLSKIGEFGLIERIKKTIKNDPTVIIGPGDDCAVLKYNKNNYQLFSTDMLVEGVDFTKDTNPYLVGRKALAVSISDISACGGIPTQAVVSLGLPKDTTLNSVDRINKGINDLAKIYKINIVGGDISSSRDLVINVSILGIVEKKRLVKRSGAKIKDVIMVSGELGGTIKGKHLKFTPRLKEARYLVENFKVNAMIDISDGLTQDLNHILEASNKGALIYESLIPISKQAKNLQDALSGGEDFELLFTLSKAQAEKLFIRFPGNFRPIGVITGHKYGLRLVKRNAKVIKIKPKGFRHF